MPSFTAPKPITEVDLFRCAYRTQTGQHPSRAEVDAWQHSETDSVDYVRAAFLNDRAAEVQKQLDQVTEYNTRLHIELERQDLVIERLQGNQDS